MNFSKTTITLSTMLAVTLSFALPKSADLVTDMGLGYNIGNTMEVPGNPTEWGNSFPTAEYVKAIKAAGFNTVRIPCAWDSHASNGTINAGWLDSVKTVVDLVIDEGMYAILNSHWDNGWLEDNVFSGSHPDRDGILVQTDSSAIRKLQENYWTQIANHFKNYDEHLLFASANEPGVNDDRSGNQSAFSYTDNGQLVFDQSRMVILQRLHEACLRAVRSTGRNNETRTVIVQMPRTEIDKQALLANNYPTDPAGTGYTMAEAHYYPYQFSLMETDADWGKTFWYWEDKTPGDDAAHTCSGTSLGSKKSIEEQFDILKTSFTSKGIPVVIGEMGAIKRLNLVGTQLKYHLEARAAWYGYTVKSAKARGIIPVIWDTGDEGNGNMSIIRRQTGKFGGNVGDIVDYEVLNAMRAEYGMTALDGNSIDDKVNASLDSSKKVLEVTYQSVRTDSSETGTMRINVNKDWSAYTAISFDAKVDVTSNTIPGEEYGWHTLSFFVMTGNWTWSDYNFEADNLSSNWNTYTIPFSELNSFDASQVNAIGINLYGTAITGTIYYDNILLWKADGTCDTLESFDKNLPEFEGIASGKLVAGSTTALEKRPSIAKASVGIQVLPGIVTAEFQVAKAGTAKVALLNSLGQTIANEIVHTNAGINSVHLNTNYRGAGFLVIKQESLQYSRAIRLK